MKQESILYGVIGLLAGSLLTIVIAASAVNGNMTSMMRLMGMGKHINSDNGLSGGSMMGGQGMTMDDMRSALQSKSGDDFDKTFIAQMIVHHQGAINMANLAKTNAKHDEIKKLADAIVVAQSKEINEMKQWQTNWGYPSDANSTKGSQMMH